MTGAIRTIFLNSLAVLTAGLLLYSCKNNGSNEDPQFNRSAMLQNLAAEVILPAYASCDSALLVFKNAASAPATCSDEFFAAWMSWQKCSPFEVGPATQEVLRQNVNTYPTDTTQIIKNIKLGNYMLASADNIDAKGFPAIDFLLFGKRNGDADPQTKFNGSDGAAYKAYLQALVDDLYSRVHSVYTNWKNGYQLEFPSKSGTSVGSSTGDLVNELNFDLELIKNFKLGVPVGAKTLGIPQPDKAEALYNGNSVMLALENLRSLKKAFTGHNGQGLDDYLEFTDAKYNGSSLAAKILEQFNITEQKLQLVADPLSASVLNDKATVEAAYNEVKKLSVLLKTDMPSALGILITYQDNDGD